MKNLLKLEELAMLGLCVYFLYSLNVAWWYYLLLLCGPDISMLGYLAGKKLGAIVYNLFHHKGIAIMFFFISVLFGNSYLERASIILFGHSSLDRMLDYGLKYFQGFGYTHLGLIGKKHSQV